MFLSKWKAIFIKIKASRKLYYETIHKKAEYLNMDPIQHDFFSKYFNYIKKIKSNICF